MGDLFCNHCQYEFIHYFFRSTKFSQMRIIENKIKFLKVIISVAKTADVKIVHECDASQKFEKFWEIKNQNRLSLETAANIFETPSYIFWPIN